MTIRAVVFDFGGVLFDWSPHHLYRKLIADDHERQWFLDTICTQAWNTEQDAGRTLADATRTLIDQYPCHETLIQAYYERWHEMLRGPLPEGVAILNALHAAHMPLFGLTNWSAETFPYARAHYPFLQCFRNIVVSGELKLIKPDPAIYHASLAQVRACRISAPQKWCLSMTWPAISTPPSRWVGRAFTMCRPSIPPHDCVSWA